MNYTTAVLLINKNIRAVLGQYEEHSKKTVFKTIDQELKVDDIAVVESDTRWNKTVVKITDVDVDVDFDSSTPVGWVVGKVDTAEHDGIIKMEAKAIDMIKKGELRKRREDIRKNTLDAVTAGEIDHLDIVRIGTAPAAPSPLDE